MSNPGSTFSKLSLLSRRLLTIAFKNPTGLRPVLGYALGEAGNHLDKLNDTSRVPAITLSELANECKERIEIVTCFFSHAANAISPTEALAIGFLLKRINARRVFEIGTNRGVSTTQLALNVGENGQVFTLDLPRHNRKTQFDVTIKEDIELVNQLEKADLIPDYCRARVICLEEDSATFDESPYVGTMDAVFVDGAHNYEYVRSDSEKSWRMLRPGGVLMWHDCLPYFPDVMRYIIQSDFKAQRVEHTSLAFATKPE